MLRFAAALLCAAAIAAPPNIVLIVSDDQGWNDVGYHGSEVRTPQIDRLAREGIELDRFYVCPVCTPTRAGLLTGRYAIRFGMQRAVNRPFLETGIPASEITLAEMLAAAGYQARGAIGKWHVGHFRRAHHPLNQGFTFFYGHYNGNIDYFTHHREGELDWHRDFEPSYDVGYSTDLIADEAAEFISAQAGERPFFLYVPFNAPHAPLQVPERWLRHYDNIADKNRRTNAAMITAMDDGIGRILAAIERAGIRRDTLVWFFSDNGAGPGDNTPLRGGKGTLYEGGIRVPAAIRWPNGFEGGRKLTAQVTYLDVFPTLREAAGIAAEPGNPLDGRSALPILRGQQQPDPEEFYSFYQRYGSESLALIDGGWKLVRQGPPILGPDPADAPPEATLVRNRITEPQIELFHLSEDLLEKTNLAAGHPSRVEAMLTKLRRFRALRPAGGVPPMTAPAPPGWKAPKEWRMKD